MNIRKMRKTEATFPDGVRVEDYGNGEFIEIMNEVYKKSDDAYTRWIAWLRAYGVKAAHPDDGWHERDKHYFQFAYPKFNDGIEIGDMVALGSPECFRVLTVHRIEKRFWGSEEYHYFPYI